MKSILLGALVMLVGCGSPPATKELAREPVFALLLPKTDSSWREELQRGFVEGAKQYDLQIVLRDYTMPEAKSVLEAADTLPALDGGVACVVFNAKSPVQPAVSKMRDNGQKAITIGEDNALSGRIGHVGEASSRLAYLFSLRASQLNPPPKRVLAIVGDDPVHRDGIKGSLFTRSDGWRKFQLRVRSASDALTQEMLDWPDVILAIGEKAVTLASRSRAIVMPADGSQQTLDGIRNGKYPIAFVPDYFQMGYRAVRIAREQFVQGRIETSTIQIDWREVDKTTLDWFLKKRFALPPAITARED